MRFRQSSAGQFRNPLFNQPERGSWILRHPRWMLAIITLLIGAGLYLVYGLPTWRLTTLTLEGTYTLPVNDLREVTLRQMQSRWLLVFRQDRLWAFDTAAYERRLRERWIFTNLHISRRLPGTLRLVVTEEKPAFTYATGSQIFGVDQKGSVSTVIGAQPEKAVQLTFVIPPTDVKLGTELLTVSDAAFLHQWLAALQGRSNELLELRGVSLNASPDRTAQLRVAAGWDIIVDRTQLVQAQIAAFFAAFDQKLQGRKLQYVNVTVPARVYYK